MLPYFASAPLLFLLAYTRGIHAQDDDSTNATSANAAPVVDLGYSLYSPTSVNNAGQYYNFSNIRYAAPPLGNLRWRDPQPPPRDRRRINDGSLGYTCLQSTPLWFAEGNEVLGDLAAYIPPGLSGQQQSEDCLFLDVITPFKVFRQRQSKGGKLAPVLVNIHGGGFWQGDKTVIYWPGGLLERSQNEIVYVSLNYRLAALGFLSHLEPSSSNYTSPNAGLLDQRFALKWVQKYIHLFGGDPKQVTILGESAGGASVQYQTVAYGGAKENDLFIRGIAQSPAPLVSDPIYPRLGANLFLKNAGVRSVDEARRLPTEVLRNANLKAQAATPFNLAYFGPTIDGNLLLDILPRSYNEGKYIKDLSLITSDNRNESRFLGNQSIKTNADFNNWVYTNFPSASSNIKSYIINDLYPPKYDGSLPYTSPQQRSDLATTEYLISCNTISIANAYNKQTYNYVFSIPPAIHAQDLAYTYYPTGTTPGFYPEIAIALQGYLTQFVLKGNPNGNRLPNWPTFSQQANAIDFTTSGVELTTSDAANGRCTFWNQGSYYPKASSLSPQRSTS